MWELKPVSELCLLAIDCVNKTAPLSEDITPYKMLRTTNIKSGFIDFETVRYVGEDIFAKWTRRAQPQYGDVVFTREAPAGEVGRFTAKSGKYFLGQRLFLYRTNPTLLDWNYLAYVLQSPQIQGYVNGIAYGATVPHMAVSDMEHLKIPVPPITVQKKIGDILSHYDDLIESNLRRIKLLEEMAQINYEEWFVRLRFPGHTTTPIDKNTSLPEGWRIVNLGSCFSHEIGGGWGEDEISEEFSKSAHVIRGTDMDGLASGDIYGVPLRFHKENNLSSRRLKSGDIIFEVSGGSQNEGVAKTALITDSLLLQFSGDVMCASFCKLARPVSEKHSPFLFHFLRFLRKTKATEVFEIRSASNIVNYNWTAFLKFQNVKLPSIRLLELFDNSASSMHNQIYNLAKQNQHLREARDILLPRLMTGVIDAEKYQPENFLKKN